MDFSLSSSLIGNAVSNPDKLALNLQFAIDKTLTARKGPTPAFTRASAATFVGSNGLIQTAAVNAPRFDHDPVTPFACKGLLIEESRTNVALYSGALVIGTGWLSSETTSVVDGTGPDGNNAYAITETSITAIHTIANTGGIAGVGATSVVSGTVYTGSIFIKKATGSIDWIQLTLGSGGFGTSQYANFNINTGAVGNSAGLASGTSPRIENYGNGWYRCSISVAATATTLVSLNTVLAFINNTNGATRAPSYAGNIANKALVSLCQFEVGSFATSYIPTTTASVVRSSDMCSITGSAFAGFYNASQGSLFANSFTPVNGQRTIIAFDDNTANEMIRLRTEGTDPFYKVTDGGIDVVALDAGTIVANTSFRFSSAYAVNDFAATINGGTMATSTSGTLPTVNQMRIGAGQSGNTICGCISNVKYFQKRLSNSKLQALT